MNFSVYPVVTAQIGWRKCKPVTEMRELWALMVKVADGKSQFILGDRLSQHLNFPT